METRKAACVLLASLSASSWAGQTGSSPGTRISPSHPLGCDSGGSAGGLLGSAHRHPKLWGGRPRAASMAPVLTHHTKSSVICTLNQKPFGQTTAGFISAPPFLEEKERSYFCARVGTSSVFWPSELRAPPFPTVDQHSFYVLLCINCFM